MFLPVFICGLIQIKTPSYQYKDFYYKDEMVVWDHLIFIMEIPILVRWRLNAKLAIKLFH